VGGLLAAWFASTTSTSVPVLAMNRAVQTGQKITAEDLTVATLPHDPALHAIPSDQRQQIIGQYAAVPWLPGQIVTPDSTTATLTPPAGTSLVGVAVTPTQLPSEPLIGGQRIVIVATANAQDDPPTSPPASGIEATVVSTAPVQDTDKTIVNVTVDADLASTLASQVATGRIAIVVLTPGAGG